jgi:hypothetical protein
MYYNIVIHYWVESVGFCSANGTEWNGMERD